MMKSTHRVPLLAHQILRANISPVFVIPIAVAGNVLTSESVHVRGFFLTRDCNRGGGLCANGSREK